MAKKPTAAEPQRKRYHYSVWVDDQQRALIDEAAQAEGEEHASTWIRKLAIKAARAVTAERDGVTHGKGGGKR